MDWSKPTASEHVDVVLFIKRIRRTDVICGIIFGLLSLLVIGISIYAFIDKFRYGIALAILGLFLLIVSIGMFVSDLGQYRKIMAQDYMVSRCRVKTHFTAVSGRHTSHYLILLCPNGNESKYTVHKFVYKQAKEGRRALLVDYSESHKGHREIPSDVVIPDTTSHRDTASE